MFPAAGTVIYYNTKYKQHNQPQSHQMQVAINNTSHNKQYFCIYLHIPISA